MHGRVIYKVLVLMVRIGFLLLKRHFVRLHNEVRLAHDFPEIWLLLLVKLVFIVVTILFRGGIVLWVQVVEGELIVVMLRV